MLSSILHLQSRPPRISLYKFRRCLLITSPSPHASRVPRPCVLRPRVPRPRVSESRIPESYVSESQSYVSESQSHVPVPRPRPMSPSHVLVPRLRPMSPSHVPVPLLVTAVHSKRILAVSPKIWQRGSSIKHTESTPKDLRGFPKRFPKKYPKQFLKRFPMHFPPENIVAISLLPTARSSLRWKGRPEMEEMARTIRETSHGNGNFR